MRSIQALSWLGIVKLYIGAPSTTMSAARNSFKYRLTGGEVRLERGFGRSTLPGGEMRTRQMRQRRQREVAIDDFKAGGRFAQTVRRWRRKPAG